MATTIVGTFDTGLAAKQAVEALVRAGIPRSNISLVAGDPSGEYARYAEEVEGADRGELTAPGAASGAVLGGALGLLAGITAVAIPGLGPIIAAGPIAAALTGTAIGAGVGAATGGVIGYLVERGVPETEAGYYAEAVRRGSTLVAVEVPESEAERVARILEQSGARDIEELVEEWRQAGWTRPDREEELQLGERAAPRGVGGVASRVERTGRPAAAGSPAYERFESDFRQHCIIVLAAAAPAYEEYAPAYRYGHTLASDPQLAGRDWSQVEADARQRWEARSPGTWERFKEAIRYAWDRVRGRTRAA